MPAALRPNSPLATWWVNRRRKPPETPTAKTYYSDFTQPLASLAKRLLIQSKNDLSWPGNTVDWHTVSPQDHYPYILFECYDKSVMKHLSRTLEGWARKAPYNSSFILGTQDPERMEKVRLITEWRSLPIRTNFETLNETYGNRVYYLPHRYNGIQVVVATVGSKNAGKKVRLPQALTALAQHLAPSYQHS